MRASLVGLLALLVTVTIAHADVTVRFTWSEDTPPPGYALQYFNIFGCNAANMNENCVPAVTSFPTLQPVGLQVSPGNYQFDWTSPTLTTNDRVCFKIRAEAILVSDPGAPPLLSTFSPVLCLTIGQTGLPRPTMFKMVQQ